MPAINKLLSTVLVIGFLGAAMPAQAGFYIEPAITYEKGDNEVNWPAPLNKSTGDSSGFGIGVKFGFHVNDILFVGLDGHYSQPKFESSNDYSADSTSILYGAIVGAQMPVAGLRIWGGYIFGGSLDPEADNGVDPKFEEAKGPKIGVGFKLMMVSLNVEYMDLEYGKTSLDAGPFAGELDAKLKNKLGMVSVSFPFTL